MITLPVDALEAVGTPHNLAKTFSSGGAFWPLMNVVLLIAGCIISLRLCLGEEYLTGRGWFLHGRVSVGSPVLVQRGLPCSCAFNSYGGTACSSAILQHFESVTRQARRRVQLLKKLVGVDYRVLHHTEGNPIFGRAVLQMRPATNSLSLLLHTLQAGRSVHFTKWDRARGEQNRADEGHLQASARSMIFLLRLASAWKDAAEDCTSEAHCHQRGSCNWNTDWWIYSPLPWQWAWSQVSGSSNVMVSVREDL